MSQVLEAPPATTTSPETERHTPLWHLGYAHGYTQCPLLPQPADPCALDFVDGYLTGSGAHESNWAPLDRSVAEHQQELLEHRRWEEATR